MTQVVDRVERLGNPGGGVLGAAVEEIGWLKRLQRLPGHELVLQKWCRMPMTPPGCKLHTTKCKVDMTSGFPRGPTIPIMAQVIEFGSDTRQDQTVYDPISVEYQGAAVSGFPPYGPSSRSPSK